MDSVSPQALGALLEEKRHELLKAYPVPGHWASCESRWVGQRLEGLPLGSGRRAPGIQVRTEGGRDRLQLWRGCVVGVYKDRYIWLWEVGLEDSGC